MIEYEDLQQQGEADFLTQQIEHTKLQLRTAREQRQGDHKVNYLSDEVKRLEAKMASVRKKAA